MKFTTTILQRLPKRRLTTAVFITVSLAAFATLGGDRDKKGKKNESLIPLSSKTFSLRTGYNYRSNNLFDLTPQREFIILNTVTTYQKGNTTYVLPLKKKVLLEKIKFNLR